MKLLEEGDEGGGGRGRGILAKLRLNDMIGSGMYNVFGVRLLCAPLFESQFF